ncbi:MAG: rhomboid family intramembrane serine protease [Deinococcota bacterium]
MLPLRDNNPKSKPAFFMWLILAINVGVFIYQLSLDGRIMQQQFILQYGFIPRLFFANPVGNAYRLITSMFMHGSLAHIASNMFFLWVFADNIEDRLGDMKFLGFYLLGGVLATLAHGLFSLRSPVPMVGASGAISAVLGAYIVLFPRCKVLTLIPPFFVFWLPAWFYLGYWGVLQFVEATSGVIVGNQGGVAWWAHVGGFVYGVLMVRNFTAPSPYDDKQPF